MWILKTEKDFKKDRREKKITSLLIGFLSGLFIFALLVIGELTGCSNKKVHTPYSVKKVIRLLPEKILMLSISSLCAAFFVYRSEKRYVCDKCFKEEKFVNSIQCSCGGKYIDLQIYKWKED